LIALAVAALPAAVAARVAEVPPARSLNSAIPDYLETVRAGAQPAIDALDTAVNGTGAVVAGAGEYDKGYASQRHFDLQQQALSDSNPARRNAALGAADNYRSKSIARGEQLVGRGKALQAAGRGAGYMSSASVIVEAGNAAARGDLDTAKLVLAQEAADVGVEELGTRVAASVCGPHCAATFRAGTAVGTAIRNVDTCLFRDCGPTGSYTVQDGVTDMYFKAYETVDHFRHPENDPASREFEEKWTRSAQANRARAQAHGAQLMNQQRQLDAQRAVAMAQEAQADDDDDGFAGALLSGLMQGVLMAQDLEGDSSEDAAGNLDCHDGHDEQAHPGGCHEPSLDAQH